MRVVAQLVQAHGDSARLELVYFWAAVLLALTPVLIFGGIGALVLRKIWRERQAAAGPGAGRGVVAALHGASPSQRLDGGADHK